MNGGNIIREMRMQHGLSLKELALKANVNYVFLSRLERNIERPSEDLVRRLADVLHYEGNIDELIASFGQIPSSIEKYILDDPSAVIDLPAFFKSRRKRMEEK